MGQQFCTVCGAKLSENTRFCESCGARVEQGQAPAPSFQPSPQPSVITPAPVTAAPKRFPVKIVIGIIIVLIIIAAGAAFVVLPRADDGSIILPGQATPVPTTIPTPEPTPVPTETTIIPTPTPDPFPNALNLRDVFTYNEGKYKSRATVYRRWLNETYHWHNDMDNHYYTEPVRSNPNYQYLFVFINIENIGSDGYPYPKSSMITLHNEGNVYRVDTTHYLPDKSGNLKATPIEVQEIESLSDFFNLELVEDYGYSHGTTQDFVLPGQGNAIDGYLIYKVPKSLTLDKTYVQIIFDGQDQAVWKLA